MNKSEQRKAIQALVSAGEIYGYTHIGLLEVALKAINSWKKANEKRWKGTTKAERSAHAKMMVTIRDKK